MGNFGLKGHFRDPGFDQKIQCGIRKKASYVNGKKDFTATQEAGLAKI